MGGARRFHLRNGRSQSGESAAHRRGAARGSAGTAYPLPHIAVGFARTSSCSGPAWPDHRRARCALTASQQSNANRIAPQFRPGPRNDVAQWRPLLGVVGFALLGATLYRGPRSTPPTFDERGRSSREGTRRLACRTIGVPQHVGFYTSKGDDAPATFRISSVSCRTSPLGVV